MRIVQINYVNYNWSTGRTCQELRIGLEKEGHEVYTVSTSEEKCQHDYRISSAFDMKIHALWARLSGKEGYCSGRTTKKMLKWMSELPPDLVILRNVHSNYINLPLLFEFLSEYSVPVIIALDDCWWYTGKCTHYTVDGCYKWKKECAQCPRLKKDIPSFWLDRTRLMQGDKKKWVDRLETVGVTGVSNWIVNEAKQSLVFSDVKKITRIYNWIDTDIFKPDFSENSRNKLGLKGKKIILGVAGEWSESKGFSRFLELSQKLNSDERIVLVGKLPINIEKCHNIVHIDQTCNMKELVDLYNAADVYVCLSEEESFGKTIAEALACGIPVIVSNSTACPELCGEGCGFVVDSRNTELVLQNIRTVCIMRNNVVRARCRRFAEEYFSLQTGISQYLELINALKNEENS